MIIGTVRPEEARAYDSKQGYHQFHNEETQEPYGSFEVFWDGPDTGPWSDEPRNYDGAGEPVQAGWYWAAGYPGCDWDSEPVGPFAYSQQAHEDADPCAPEYLDDEPESVDAIVALHTMVCEGLEG